MNAGVAPSVAKNITGHSTLMMFDRYSINPDEAVRKAAQQLDSYLADRQSSAVESVLDQSRGV